MRLLTSPHSDRSDTAPLEMSPLSPGETVCAVVVTFNRVNLLRQCLSSLRRQSQMPDCILVVDNATTDNTKEVLAREFAELQVLRLPDNVGGAGGFRAGMEWAYRHGFRWFWVMDDDIELQPDALEIMLRYRRLSEFIHSRKIVPDGVFHWEGSWDLSACEKFSFPEDISFRNGKAWTAVTYGNFEGALIHRRIVDCIGYPDPRFFLHGDDLIYGFLASLHTNVLYVNHVGLTRKLPVASSDPRRYYFLFRNRFLIYEYLLATGVPLSRAAFWFRHALSFQWHVRQLLMMRHGVRWGAVRYMVVGLWDGVRGRFGPPPWLRGLSEG